MPDVSRPPAPGAIGRSSAESLRVLVLAGVVLGVLVGGVGSRLAMFLLRVTSPEHVSGVTSDDGFTIGKVTVGGTYSLFVFGAAAGVVGAAAFFAVRPWLFGPAWLRRLTTASAAGAVVGSMVVHADGVDFTLLEPVWLSITLFVALPFAFGWFIGSVADRVAAPGSWTARAPWRWLLPAVLVGLFPLTLPLVVLAGVGVAGGTAATYRWRRAGRPRPAALVLGVRAVWLAIAVAGFIALVRDVAAIT